MELRRTRADDWLVENTLELRSPVSGWNERIISTLIWPQLHHSHSQPADLILVFQSPYA